MQEDPYRGDGLNLYGYCENNPVNYYDPSGYAKGSNGSHPGVNKSDNILPPDKSVRNSSSKLVGEELNLPWLSDKYRAVEASGTVKVGGKVRDVSRRVYQRTDIDWEYISSHPDALGRSNRELAKKGNAPFHIDDTRIELHHLTQKEPDGIVGIPGSLHDDYTKTLHGLVEDGGSFRNNPVLNKQYNNFNSKYWR